MVNRDNDFMNEALDLAQQARTKGEVPVGAVVVKDNIVSKNKGRSPSRGGCGKR